MSDSKSAHRARALMDYIDASPSPWHAVAEAAELLKRRGFHQLEEARPWSLRPGESYYVIRDDASLIAFTVGERGLGSSGFRIVGAHTDSPGFRVKPNGALTQDPLTALGAEIYGSPILASFADRDLTLAGRVFLRDSAATAGVRAQLVHFEEPLVRLPNLAIHLNREVNREGLKLDYQDQLTFFLRRLSQELSAQEDFRRLLAEQAGGEPGDLLSWRLAVVDNQPGTFWGANGEFIADGQLDNLASCHAALAALPRAREKGEGIAVAALFDHEEVGSESYKGAGGDFLETVMERIASGLGLTHADYHRGKAASWLLSADMAHAYHPSWPRHYDDQHRVQVNEGPVIKINAAQRYATDDWGEAYIARLSEIAGTPYQCYIHRNDLPCGSTIGPVLAARLGLRTVDVGSPLWAMHSARESAGALDQDHLIRLLEVFFRDPC